MGIKQKLLQLLHKHKAQQEAQQEAEQKAEQLLKKQKDEQLRNILDDLLGLFESFAKGDFTVKPKHPEAFVGEYAVLMEDAKKMIAFLIDRTSQLQNSAVQIQSGGAQISASMQQLSASAQQQASSADLLDEKAKEISEGIAENSQQTKEISKKCKETGEAINDVSSDIKNFQGIMEIISHRVAEMDEKLEKIGEVSKQINILALNTHIEAARKGNEEFQVIAGQLQTLNDTTVQLAKDIGISKQAIEEPILNGGELLKGIVDKSEEINKQAQMIINATNIISKTTEEQSDAAEHIAKEIDLVKESAEINSATVQQMAAGAEAIQAQIDSLEGSISSFKVS